MNWKDFFYFSKGERRALILLLLLITMAWLVLILTGRYSPIEGAEKIRSGTILYPVCLYFPDTAIKTAESPSLLKEEKRTVKKQPASPAELPFFVKSTRVEKYPQGTVVELNTADTTTLKKIPGIGSAFSNRIVKYRNLLGGFYSVSQLAEVYGIDEERYTHLKNWFCVNPELIRKRKVNKLPLDSLSRHPYITYKQAKVIKQLCRQKGKLTGWENLQLLEEFTPYDKERIGPYLSFD